MTSKRYEYLLLPVFMVFLTFGCSAGSKSVIPNKDAPVAAAAPLDMPDERPLVIPELILGSGDKIDISVYRSDDFKTSQTISFSGKIMLPLLGDVQAAGLTAFQLRDNIRDRLSKYLVDPQVYVGVTSTVSQKITVMGEVVSPGIFQSTGQLTIIEVLSKAGGVTLDGKRNNVILVRGGLKKPTVMALNVENMFSEEGIKDNIYLQSGDIVYVPRTFISDVDRFFNHFATIISPFTQLETGYFIGSNIESSNSGSTAVSTK